MSIKTELLPQCIESEKALLGGILIVEDSFSQVADVVSEDDFAILPHRYIWRTMEALHKAGIGIDRITVATKLNDLDQLQAIGGLSYLTSLDEGLGTVFGLDDYATRVKKKSIARQAVIQLYAHAEEIQLHGESDEVLERAEQTVHNLSAAGPLKRKLKTAEEIITAAGGVDNFFAASDDGIVPTPFYCLNNALGGGLRPGQMVILAARPSIGKTAVALQFGEAAAMSDMPPAIFSAEMENEALLMRMACGRAGVDANKVRNKTLSDIDVRRLNKALGEIAQLPIFYDDTAAVTLSAIRAELRKLMARQHIGLVIIDYLQLMQIPGKYENRNQAVSALSRGLKLLAKELRLPFLVLSQLKRLDGNDRPGLSDLRESGAIEQDADIVMFLHADPLDKALVRKTTLDLAKQRNGPVDDWTMEFDRTTTRLSYLPGSSPRD